MSSVPSSSATSAPASAASRYVSGPARPLTQAEAELIGALLEVLPDRARLNEELPNALVQAMNDGGMGSLRFTGVGSVAREAVTAHAADEDGVPLNIAISLDENRHLYELDIWKVDFSPLKRIPSPSQVQLA